MTTERSKGSINRDGHKIRVSGHITISDLARFLHAIYIAVAEKEYTDILLDFSDLKFIDQKFMLPALPIINKHKRESRVFFALEMPTAENIHNLFINANWAHFISQGDYDKTDRPIQSNVPARQYKNSEEHDECINDIMSVLVGLLDLDSGSKQLNALEWSLGEITDNVLDHAQSPVGGFIQVFSNTDVNNPYVEFMVADAGIGIPASLSEREHDVALERAIQEGVTRDSSTNAGNGLYGTYKMAKISGGSFAISSHHGVLICKDGADVNAYNSKTPYAGTYVICKVMMNKDNLLKDGLDFGNRKHSPVSMFIEKEYVKDDVISFKMKERFQSFRSRDSGRKARLEIDNVISMSEGDPIEFDFENIFLISSSFADEVFGKLFTQLGAMQFMQQIKFKNVDPEVAFLIDRAIAQRTKMDLENGSNGKE